MKKGKTIIIIILVIFGVLIIDTAQALIFNNSPIIKIRENYNGGNLYCKDKGILVDTYTCGNGKKYTTFKGGSYTCSVYSDYVIVDTTKDMKDFACAEALEEIYKDSQYTYYLPCMKSKYIKVRYNGGQETTLEDALKRGIVQIGDLDKFEIDYIKYAK